MHILVLVPTCIWSCPHNLKLPRWEVGNEYFLQCSGGNPNGESIRMRTWVQVPRTHAKSWVCIYDLSPWERWKQEISVAHWSDGLPTAEIQIQSEILSQKNVESNWRGQSMSVSRLYTNIYSVCTVSHTCTHGYTHTHYTHFFFFFLVSGTHSSC